MAIALIGCAGAAHAQVETREGIALQNQILELRRDLEQLQSQVNQGGGGGYRPPPADAAPVAGSSDLNTQLLDRVTRLEDEVRSLRGRIDEVDNARQRQGEDFGKQLGDLNFKLGNAAPPAATAAPQGGPAVPPTPLAPAQPHRTPEIALQQGNAALARRDYAAAEAAAREVIAAGRGPRLADGQFLLAQSLAGRRDYEAAAVAYDDAYTRNTRGGRAAESLLGLANSLVAINQKPAACETLNKLRAEFPQMRPDLRVSVGFARQRAGCGA